MSANREYKNDVFCMLLEDPAHALDVYNAVNNSHYTDPGILEIRKLKSGISLSAHNDASFILDYRLNIYEHQSSVCPNMPLRNLIYVTELIKELVDEDNLFGRKLIKIPTPRFVVFYNGLQEQPERMILRLSDAFIKETDEPDLELKCSFYNINRGFNSQLMGNCKTLYGYMQFVDLVRCYVDQFGKDALETAISKAIDECIEKGILKDFLLKRRSEVERAMELDWSYERWFELEGREQYRDGHAEGLAEGLAEGHTEGLLEQLVVLVCKKLKRSQSREVIADALETNLETVDRIIAVAQKYAPDYDVKVIVKELLAEKGHYEGMC